MQEAWKVVKRRSLPFISDGRAPKGRLIGG